MNESRREGRYYLFALVTVVLWSTSASSVKTLTEGLSSLCVLGYSSLFASVFLLLLLFLRGQAGCLRTYGIREYGTLAGLGFLGMFLYSALYYCGIDRLSSQEACILNYLWPMMIVVFSCLILKEPFTGRKAGAVALSFSGVLLVALWGLFQGKGMFSGDGVGMVACVLAAMCYGLFCVLNKKMNLDQASGMAVFWGVTCVCAFLLCLIKGQMAVPSLAQLGGMIWLGIAVHGVPYLLWAIALNGVGNTARIADLAYLTPVLSVVISAVALGESLSPVYLIALILILGGIMLQIPGGEKRRSKKVEKVSQGFSR